ncbi:hypothetical protein D3C72_1290880 [compost metagenome]
MRGRGYGGVHKVQPPVAQHQLRDVDWHAAARAPLARLQRRLQGRRNLHIAVVGAHDGKVKALDGDGVEHRFMPQEAGPLGLQHDPLGARLGLTRRARYHDVGQHHLPEPDLYVAHLAARPQQA